MNIDLNSPNFLIIKDADDHLLQLIHLYEPYIPEENPSDATELATQYMQDVADVYESSSLINDLNNTPSFEITKNFSELRLLSNVEKFYNSYFFYSQTYFGLPIWNKGMIVEVITDNMEIRLSKSSVDHNHFNITAPEEGVINNYSNINSEELRSLLNVPQGVDIIINDSSSVCIYQYIPNDRFMGELPYGVSLSGDYSINSVPDAHTNIEENEYYIVRQVFFSLDFHWRCLIEINSGSILLMEVFCSCVNGAIMDLDPVTQGTAPSTSFNVDVVTNSQLNPYAVNVALNNLNAPDSNGYQHLRGQYARVIDPVLDVNDPMLVYPFPGNQLTPAPFPPKEQSPYIFNYDVRTEKFAAVNSYYHVDRFLSLMVDLGLQLKPSSLSQVAMLPNTDLPIRVDHRAFESSQNTPIGGGCVGNSSNTIAIGIAFAKMTLAALTQTPPPPEPDYYGCASSYRLMLHELCHVILLDHIHTPGFVGFCHSFGDTLAAILNDPYSAYAPPSTSNKRFATYEWDNSGVSKGSDRRHDRDTLMYSGWYWGGNKDNGSINYNAEQLLSTTFFNAYRALGGDSTNPVRRESVSRMIIATILRTVRYLVSAPPPFWFSLSPVNASDFCSQIIYRENNLLPNEPPIQVDNTRIGTSHKVIRWAFENMAAFNPVSSTPPSSFSPPPNDIYIDDGRNGEYSYLDIFWNTSDIINRHQNDGITNFYHQNPIVGSTNYLFVKVKNRGVNNADSIEVKAYLSAAGGGNIFPNDWTEINALPVSGGSGLQTGQSLIVGPITWVPPSSSFMNHYCILVTVNCLGDLNNIWYPLSSFQGSFSIPDWYLIPNDNNIAQRNMSHIPSEEGSLAIADTIAAYPFLLRNPYTDSLRVNLEVRLPNIMVRNHWDIVFENGNEYILDAFDREGILINMRIVEGTSFSKQDIIDGGDYDIIVVMQSEKGIIGGMTYRLDTNLGG